MRLIDLLENLDVDTVVREALINQSIKVVNNGKMPKDYPDDLVEKAYELEITNDIAKSMLNALSGDYQYRDLKRDFIELGLITKESNTDFCKVAVEGRFHTLYTSDDAEELDNLEDLWLEGHIDLSDLEDLSKLHNKVYLVCNNGDSCSGYPFLIDTKGLNWQKVLSIRKAISSTYERYIDKKFDGGWNEYAEGMWFDTTDSYKNGNLFLDKWDISPYIKFYDSGVAYSLKFCYTTELDEEFEISFNSNEFHKGKLKILSGKDVCGVIGKDNIFSLMSMLRYILSQFVSRYPNLVFEEIMIVPFSSQNSMGVGHYISTNVYWEITKDFTDIQKGMYDDNEMHCRGIVTLV